MGKRAACTIVSANYFAFARTLARSFRIQHPEDEFFILIVDRRSELVDAAAHNDGLQTLYVEDLGIADFRSISFKYDILEFNTGVKPTFLKYLLNMGFDKVIYLDPDIYVYSSLDFIYERLETSNIVVTPHATAPIVDLESPTDEEFSAVGVFNLGFIAVNGNCETRRFLDWWENRCLQLGYREFQTGIFVDQKWMDLAPCYFDGLYILKHKGCNVAHWNFQERQLEERPDGWSVNGVPFVFFHFSGIDIGTKLQISKHRNTTYAERPELLKLFEPYREQVRENGHMRFVKSPYGFGRFSNGKPISLIARRMYSIHLTEFAGEDPFDSHGIFYKLADKSNLLRAYDLTGKVTMLNYDKNDWHLRVIRTALRCILKVVGGERYTMLMKYLSYISVLRHQRDVVAWRMNGTSKL